MDRPANSKPHIEFVRLPDDEKRRRLYEARASRPKDEPMWVFAFGSLMWNPCFEYDVASPATLRGYDRKFSFWTSRGRGTPENPGLGLCIEDCAGACRGVAYRLVEDHLEDAWECLWEREMGSGIYRAQWLGVETDEYGRVPALTFVVDKRHPHYTGKLSLETMAAYMAGARGVYGTNRDYLAGTIEEMRKLNVVDQELIQLLAEVDRIEKGETEA